MSGLISVESSVTVINTVQAFPCVEDLGSKLLMQRIPHLYSNKGLTTEEQRHDFALPAEIRHLAMYILMLDQAADLSVNHPVKLGDQYDIVSQLSMLRKEGQPLGPAGLLPFTSVKYQLALIDHKKDGSFLWLLGSKALPAKVGQKLRC